MAQNPNQNARTTGCPCNPTSLKYQRPGAQQTQASPNPCGEPSRNNNMYPGQQSTLMHGVCRTGNSMTTLGVPSIHSLRSAYGAGRNCPARTQVRTTAFGRPARMGAPQIRHGVCPARKSSSRQLQTQNNMPAQRRAVQLSPETRDNTCPETMVNQEYSCNEVQLGSRYHPSRMPDQATTNRSQPTYCFNQSVTPEARCPPRVNQRRPAVPAKRMSPMQTMQSPALDISARSNVHPTVQMDATQRISSTQMPFDISHDRPVCLRSQSPTLDKMSRTKGYTPSQQMQFNDPKNSNTFNGTKANRKPQSPQSTAVAVKHQNNVTEATSSPAQGAAATSPTRTNNNGKEATTMDQNQCDADNNDQNQIQPTTSTKQNKICARRSMLCQKKEQEGGGIFKRFINAIYAIFNYIIGKTSTPATGDEFLKTGQGVCPQLQQLHGLHNLFMTNNMRLANIPDSIKECADAKKCGLVAVDKFDICGAENASRQQQINTLATDTYCPGIIQEAVDGMENFNAVAFNMINMDLKEKPIEKPAEEPVTLLEAFEVRIKMEREALKLKVTADAPKQDIIEAVQRFFNEKHNPTDLNRSISSFLLTEFLEDRNVVEESKKPDHPFKAEVLKYFTLTPDYLGIQHVVYLGTTRYDNNNGYYVEDVTADGADADRGVGGSDEVNPIGAVAILSSLTKRLTNNLVKDQRNYRKR